jgi:hypothetical protein
MPCALPVETRFFARAKTYSLHSPVCRYGLSISLSVSRPHWHLTHKPTIATLWA